MDVLRLFYRFSCVFCYYFIVLALMVYATSSLLHMVRYLPQRNFNETRGYVARVPDHAVGVHSAVCVPSRWYLARRDAQLRRSDATPPGYRHSLPTASSLLQTRPRNRPRTRTTISNHTGDMRSMFFYN